MNWTPQEKGVWTAYHNGKVYLLKSFEAPIANLKTNETRYRDLVR